MYLDTFLRNQFGKPSGLFGSVFMRPVLNLANGRVVDRAIAMLNPSEGDSILDIGFGGGYSLVSLARMVRQGRVEGLDYSSDMVASAAEMLRGKRLSKGVRVQWGDVAKLPFRARTFDKVLSVNSLYYWPDPATAFREIARVVKPNGRVAIGFRPAMALRPFTWTWEGFKLYEGDEVIELMRQAGLTVRRIDRGVLWPIPEMVVVVGERPAARTTTVPRRSAASRRVSFRPVARGRVPPRVP